MYDAVLAHLRAAEQRTDSPAFEWEPGTYALATIHRAENTDDLGRLRTLIAALDRIAREVCAVVLAAHPRTRKALESYGITADRVNMIPPLAYSDMLLFERRARMILTDSGGVQKEAYFLRVPCVTLRDETEWVETLENSCNTLVGAADADKIVEAARRSSSVGPWREPYGAGDAAEVIVRELVKRSTFTAAEPLRRAVKGSSGSGGPAGPR
jgi:UDP-GlcNAc3NAcA epimerase